MKFRKKYFLLWKPITQQHILSKPITTYRKELKLVTNTKNYRSRALFFHNFTSYVKFKVPPSVPRVVSQSVELPTTHPGVEHQMGSCFWSQSALNGCFKLRSSQFLVKKVKPRNQFGELTIFQWLKYCGNNLKPATRRTNHQIFCGLWDIFR